MQMSRRGLGKNSREWGETTVKDLMYKCAWYVWRIKWGPLFNSYYHRSKLQSPMREAFTFLSGHYQYITTTTITMGLCSSRPCIWTMCWLTNQPFHFRNCRKDISHRTAPPLMELPLVLFLMLPWGPRVQEPRTRVKHNLCWISCSHTAVITVIIYYTHDFYWTWFYYMRRIQKKYLPSTKLKIHTTINHP